MADRRALLRLAALLYARHWRRALFFSACVGAGVSFLVGVGGLRAAMEGAAADRARELLAADVEISSQRPLDARARAALARLKGEGHAVLETLSFSSMLGAPGGEAFLVSVKAVPDAYPFYGRLETKPAGARGVLLDETAAAERGLAPGARLTLGGLSLTLDGLIVKEPDRTMTGFNLAPRVMIPLGLAEKTGLMRFGARLRRSALIALPAGAGPERAAALKARLEKELDDPYVSLAAYTDADPAVRETLERVTTFFVFLSLVGLLLGAVGMASSMALFLADQLETAGTLRCLGATPRDVGLVYGLVCLAVGAQGGLLGCAAGWALGAAFLEPAARWLGLSFPVEPRLSVALLAEGFFLACALALGLNWGKVAAVSRVSPMDVLRERAEALVPGRRARTLGAAAGLLFLFFYSFAKSNSWQAARSFVLALGASSLVAALLISAALAALARLPLSRMSFAVRHGVLALTRNRARTLVFMFTLSLGLTLLGALGIVHRSLRGEILLGRSESAPDLFLIDIQKSQLAGVRSLLARLAKVEARPAPLIRARLSSVDGVTVVRRDAAGMTVEEKARQRFLTREYNLTYKDELQDSEELVEGAFWRPGETAAQISLEKSFAKRVGARLGSRLVFDVQGRPVEGVVTSLRKVDWISMRPNFFVVFPAAVLEPAPQTFITSVKAGDAAASAALRRELAKAYPNVSVIDLSKVLDNVQAVLGTLIEALNVLAWFCLAVGLLVLAGTLGLGRRERLRQAELYRVLGCPPGGLLRMDAVEFLVLGGVSFSIAAATSHLLGWAVARQMGVGFAADPKALAVMAAAALLLPPAVGLFVNRRLYTPAR